MAGNLLITDFLFEQNSFHRKALRVTCGHYKNLFLTNPSRANCHSRCQTWLKSASADSVIIRDVCGVGLEHKQESQKNVKRPNCLLPCVCRVCAVCVWETDWVELTGLRSASIFHDSISADSVSCSVFHWTLSCYSIFPLLDFLHTHLRDGNF